MSAQITDYNTWLAQEVRKLKEPVLEQEFYQLKGNTVQYSYSKWGQCEIVHIYLGNLWKPTLSQRMPNTLPKKNVKATMLKITAFY